VIEALCGSSEMKVCFSALRFLGVIELIAFDQHKTPIEWNLVDLPEYCSMVACDSRHNEMIRGYEPRLESLNCEIANAMTATLEDRGFSRYVKKQIVGRWSCLTSALDIHGDGTYAASGCVEDVAPLLPAVGKWFCGNRMLHFMNRAVDAGVRVPIVSISASELRFHGRNDSLFQLYIRE